MRCSGVRGQGDASTPRLVREISHPREEPGGDSEEINGGAIAAITATIAAELTSESPRSSTAPSQRRPRAAFLHRQNSSAAPQAVPGVQRSAVQERRPAVMIDSNTTVAARRALVDRGPRAVGLRLLQRRVGHRNRRA